MKIVTPLKKTDHYETLVQAGADEFYCGIAPYAWLNQYKFMVSINRREYMYSDANSSTMNSIKILSRMVDTYKIPVKITFNSHYYLPQQYDLLVEIMKRLIDLGFDKFIMADPAFIIHLREIGLNCEIHVSGEIETLNSATIKYLNAFHVSRFVFPRKITLDDLRSCIKNSNIQGMEYEAFLLNEKCVFSGAFCNSVHCSELPHLCSISYQFEKINPTSTKFSNIDEYLKMMQQLENDKSQSTGTTASKPAEAGSYLFGRNGCGVCRIKDLMDIGITHLKVVGRGAAIEDMEKDIKNVKESINQALTMKSSSEFTKEIKTKFFAGKCPKHCYYPSELSRLNQKLTWKK